MNFALEALTVAYRSVGRDGRRLAGRGTNGTLGMDRRDLDLCDGACRHRPRALARIARSFTASPCRRPRGLVVPSPRLSYCLAHGAWRRRPALSSVARRMGRQSERAAFLVSSGAGGGGLSFSLCRSPQPLIGRISGWTFATHWASRFLRLPPSAKERRIGNWPASGETPRISPRSAMQGSGVTLAIRTISLSGSSGSPSQLSRSHLLAIIHGVGSAWRPPSSCTCCLSTCRESRRWRPTCFGRGATHSASTRRG